MTAARKLYAKARRRKGRKEMGNGGGIIVRFTLGRADFRLRWVIVAPSFPLSNPVIPAKAGIQTVSAKRAT